MPADKRDAEFEAIRCQAHSWRARLDDELATEADHAAFETWLADDPRHGDEFARIGTLWSTLGGMETGDLDPEIRAMLEATEMPASSTSSTPWRDRPWFVRVAAGTATAAIAASVLFAVVPMPTLFDGMPAPVVQSFTSARGETREIRLSDGSVLTLGADSAIDVTIGPDIRAVTLTSGEVFFDVATDASRPFTVEAGRLALEVTGTEFDVRLGREAVSVAVAEGAVDISYPAMTGGEPQDRFYRHAVRQGFAITVDRSRGIGDVRPVRSDAIAAWRGGRLAYAGTPLADVIVDANRYSAIPIRIADDQVGHIKVSGSFDAGEIDATLDILAEILPIRIDRSAGDVIRITAAGN